MIPAGSDQDGHSLRMLLEFAIRHFPLAAVYDLVTGKDRIVARMAASHLMNEKRLGERTFKYAVELARGKRSGIARTSR